MFNILKINKNLCKIPSNLHPLVTNQITNMNKLQLKSSLGIIFVTLLLVFSIKSVDPIYSNLFSSVSIINTQYGFIYCKSTKQKFTIYQHYQTQ